MYTRTQLWILLGLTAFAGAGSVVGHWRRAHVDFTTRLEGFDRGEAATSPSARTASGPTRGTRPADSGARQPLTAPTPGETRPHPSGVAPSRPRPGRDAVRPAGAESPPAGQTQSHQPSKHRLGHAPLDLNRAGIDDLVGLPGVGPALARRIVFAREEAGRFESVDDLRVVPGVGPVKLARLRDLVTVSRREDGPPLPDAKE